MPIANSYKVGADPEFVILQQGHLQQWRKQVPPHSSWGIDHGGWVYESQPRPDFSIRNLVRNLKDSLNDFATQAPEGTWKANGYLRTPEREVGLGGHVHIDLPFPHKEHLDAYDRFYEYLEKLDILPTTSCDNRRKRLHYGQKSDYRSEHGHFEYRSLPSWLFSQRVTKICLTGIKLLTVDPTAASALGSVQQADIPKLRSMFEAFKAKDEDADWLLSSGLFKRKLNVNPDRNLLDVWKITPQPEEKRWRAERLEETPNLPDDELPYVVHHGQIMIVYAEVGARVFSFSEGYATNQLVHRRIYSRIVASRLWSQANPDYLILPNPVLHSLPISVHYYGTIGQPYTGRTYPLTEFMDDTGGRRILINSATPSARRLLEARFTSLIMALESVRVQAAPMVPGVLQLIHGIPVVKEVT
jgi:hypothetical protein